MKLTRKQIENTGSCGGQLKLFVELFGEEADVTVEACVAVALKFDWELAACLFDAPTRAEYRASTRTEYHKAFNKGSDALLEHRKDCASAWATAYNSKGS